MDGQMFVVVDVETTGLSAAFGDPICEVAMVRAQDDHVLETNMAGTVTFTTFITTVNGNISEIDFLSSNQDEVSVRAVSSVMNMGPDRNQSLDMIACITTVEIN